MNTMSGKYSLSMPRILRFKRIFLIAERLVLTIFLANSANLPSRYLLWPNILAWTEQWSIYSYWSIYGSHMLSLLTYGRRIGPAVLLIRDWDISRYCVDISRYWVDISRYCVDISRYWVDKVLRCAADIIPGAVVIYHNTSTYELLNASTWCLVCL